MASDTSRDEELARSLQAEEAMAAKGTSRVGVPKKARTKKPSAARSAAETVVAMPPEDDVSVTAPAAYPAPSIETQSPRTVDRDYVVAPPETVFVSSTPSTPAYEPPSQLTLDKMIFLGKTISVATLVLWIFSISFRAWWFVLSFAGLAAPIGWWGSYNKRPRLVAIFLGSLLLDTLFQVAFPFFYPYESPNFMIFSCFLIVLTESIGTFYIWQLYTLLKPSPPSQFVIEPV